MSKVLLKRFLQLLRFYVESAVHLDKRFILDTLDDLLKKL